MKAASGRRRGRARRMIESKTGLNYFHFIAARFYLAIMGRGFPPAEYGLLIDVFAEH